MICFFSDIELSSIDSNLVDLIWHDRPQRIFNPIISLDKNITGKIIGDAVKQIRKEMGEKHSSILVITALDEIACK